MAGNLVKFVYAASATADQIAAFDANTVYFIGNTHQIYKGTTLYDGGSSSVAADLATLRNQIGSLPVDAPYTDLIDYIDESIAAGDTTVTNLVTTLENSLADVATSGAAADVSVVDEDGHFTATNVEDALEELYTAIGTGGTNAAVTVTKTAGGDQDDYAYRYVFSQGGNQIANGTIDIAKDMVATDGELVHPTPENPITIDGQQVTSGAYIRMTIANGDAFYINVADLIEYNSVSDTDEILLSDTNHTISATVGEIAASKIVYQEADAEQGISKKTVAQAINALESSVEDVDNKITTQIGRLDSTVSASQGYVLTGVTQTDGVLTGHTEIALNAQNVAYNSSTVSAALDTIGAIPAEATATTVIGYIDEKTGAGVDALNSTVTATTTAVVPAGGVVVAKTITQSAGVLVSADGVAVEPAGSVATAKSELIGTATDAANADTINGAKAFATEKYNAAVGLIDDIMGTATATAGDMNLYGVKAYADQAASAASTAAVSAAINALDATVTATLASAPTGSVVVAQSITQSDGLLYGAQGVAVEPAGAVATAKTELIGAVDDAATADTINGAKAYTDDAMTSVVGTATDTADLNTVLGAKAYADQAASAAVASASASTTAAINALDSTVTATGTALHSGVFVLSGVTQTDGLLTVGTSTEVEVAGAAAAAEAAAKAYTDSALTWGSLS